MKLYYRAVDQEGKVVRGLIEARDKKEAGYYLRKHQLLPIVISAETKFSIARFLQFFSQVSGNEVIFFTRQLSSMLTSGFTLMQALTVMKKQIKNPAMNDVLVGIIAKVEDGGSFSSALEKYPRLFSPIYIALMRAAESSGLLDKVLLRLSENLEKQQKLRSAIRGALVYPVIVIVLMIAVMVIMMVVAIPQLTEFYRSMGVKLPLSTQIIMGISNLMVNFWWLVIIGFFIVVYIFRKWYSREAGRWVIDMFILRVPLVGKLVSESLMVDFTRTLGLLVGTGSLVVDSLLKSADVVDNSIYHREIILVAKRVEKGISIGDALETSSVFPAILVQMVKIGEQTGKLDESLSYLGDFFTEEVDEYSRNFSTIIEPVMLLIIGVAVAFIALAIISPIYQLTSGIHK